MRKLAPAAPWYAPWRRRVEIDNDPADLGTAFGLDLSLQAPALLASETQPPTTRKGWVQRWTTRRKGQPT